MSTNKNWNTGELSKNFTYLPRQINFQPFTFRSFWAAGLAAAQSATTNVQTRDQEKMAMVTVYRVQSRSRRDEIWLYAVESESSWPRFISFVVGCPITGFRREIRHREPQARLFLLFHSSVYPSLVHYFRSLYAKDYVQIVNHNDMEFTGGRNKNLLYSSVT